MISKRSLYAIHKIGTRVLNNVFYFTGKTVRYGAENWPKIRRVYSEQNVIPEAAVQYYVIINVLPIYTPPTGLLRESLQVLLTTS